LSSLCFSISKWPEKKKKYYISNKVVEQKEYDLVAAGIVPAWQDVRITNGNSSKSNAPESVTGLNHPVVEQVRSALGEVRISVKEDEEEVDLLSLQFQRNERYLAELDNVEIYAQYDLPFDEEELDNSSFALPGTKFDNPVNFISVERPTFKYEAVNNLEQRDLIAELRSKYEGVLSDNNEVSKLEVESSKLTKPVEKVKTVSSSGKNISNLKKKKRKRKPTFLQRFGEPIMFVGASVLAYFAGGSLVRFTNASTNQANVVAASSSDAGAVNVSKVEVKQPEIENKRSKKSADIDKKVEKKVVELGAVLDLDGLNDFLKIQLGKSKGVADTLKKVDPGVLVLPKGHKFESESVKLAAIKAFFNVARNDESLISARGFADSVYRAVEAYESGNTKVYYYDMVARMMNSKLVTVQQVELGGEIMGYKVVSQVGDHGEIKVGSELERVGNILKSAPNYKKFYLEAYKKFIGSEDNLFKTKSAKDVRSKFHAYLVEEAVIAGWEKKDASIKMDQLLKNAILPDVFGEFEEIKADSKNGEVEGEVVKPETGINEVEQNWFKRGEVIDKENSMPVEKKKTGFWGGLVSKVKSFFA